MKKNLFILPLLALALKSNAQATEKVFQDDITPVPVEKTIAEDDDTIYPSAGIDELPQFPGGISALFKFVNDNFKKPSPDFSSRLIASIVVEKDGTLSNIKVLRTPDTETATELIRVLKKSPKWIPAKHHHAVVRCAYTLPFIFPLKAPNANATPIPDKN